jgi:small conductance mechanosensitive channel
MFRRKSVRRRAAFSLLACSPALLVIAAAHAILTPAPVRAQVPDSIQEAAGDTVPADTTPPGLTRAREILIDLDAAKDTILAFESRWRTVSEEEQELLRVAAFRLIEGANENQSELLELIPGLETAGVSVDSIRQAYGSFISVWIDLYGEGIDQRTDLINELRERRSSTPAEQLDDLEFQIEEAADRLNDLLVDQARNLAAADSIGVDTAAEWEWLEDFLVSRAENLVGRLQIATSTRERLRSQVESAEQAEAPESEVGALRLREQANELRIAGVVASLDASADILDERGFDTDQYRQFIIRATGEVTGEVLDPGVLVGLLSDLWEAAWGWLRESAPTLLVWLLIVVGIILLFRLGFLLAWRVSRAFHLVESKLLADLIERMLRPIATILGLIAGLSAVGVDPTTLLAGLGVAGIIIGLALQDSLSNLAAGFFILATRPYDVDDVIEGGGVLGTVKAMGLANTTVVTFDNRRLLVPNRKIWGGVIENRSAEQVRRVDASVRISYREDLDRAMEILRGLLDEYEKVLEIPEPDIFVSDLADSWIELAVRPWVRNEHWWPVTTELPRLMRLRFADEGIEVPYPRRDIVALPTDESVNPPPRTDQR